MLAAHIQYELDRWAPAQLAAAIQEEMGALYRWLGAVPLGEVVQPESLLASLRRNLVERPLPGELVDFLQENAVIVLELIQDEQAPLATVVPKHVYDALVENLAALEGARQELTHQIVNSSIYGRLIANVLYHGIKSFLVSEQGVARTIPGAAAFVRLGQNAINAAAPQLEKNVDKQLLAFINDNIHQLIADSETFLSRTLDAALIRKVGDEVWDAAGDASLARLTATFDKQAVGHWAAIAGDWWLHLRTTPLSDDILQAVVRSFFLRYGRQPVTESLARLGLTEEVLAAEAQALVEPLVRQALASGYLEARIRARLEPFYDAWFAAPGAGGGQP